MGQADSAPETRPEPIRPPVEETLQAEPQALEGGYVTVITTGDATCRHVWSAIGAEPCNLSVPGDGDCTIYRFVKQCYLCGRRLEY